MSRNLVLWLCSLGKLALAVWIISYFWCNDTLESIKEIPIYVLLLPIGYIILQLVTRKLALIHRWWDWVYYFGLVSIMVSVPFVSEGNLKIFNVISDYGTILLVIPVLVEIYYLLQVRKE